MSLFCRQFTVLNEKFIIMENLNELKQALESEINKNRLLEEKLRMKSFENELIVNRT